MVKSLRWRLQIWHAIVLTSVLGIFGSVVYSLHWQTRLQQIDAELDRTAEVLMSRLRRLFQGPSFRGPFRGMPPGLRNTDRPAPPNMSRGEPARPGYPPSLDLPAFNPNESPPLPPRDRSTGDRSAGDRFVNDRGPDSPQRGERRAGERRFGDSRFNDRGPGERGPGDRDSNGRTSTERTASGLGLPEEFQHLFEGDDRSRFYYCIWGMDGKVLEKSESAPEAPYPGLHLQEDGLPIRTVRSRDHWREVIHVPRGDLNILVGRSIAADVYAERSYGVLLLMAGAGVLTAGSLGGGWLAAHAIRPIVAMTATAHSISAQNLNQRIDLQDTATELGQLAVVLNQTFDRLQQAFEQQSRFTADASHELRTPLAVILAHTELALSRRRTPEEYQVTLETCQRASLRMKTLIEALLLLARFDSQQSLLESKEFELTQAVTECMDLIQPLAQARHIRMKSQLEPARICGDRDRICQVLTNLLSNAIRYNQDSGTVTVSVMTNAIETQIRVTDTGVGIPEEELPHIFERFYRVDKARSRADGGSGLGLSICKTIVEAHGGRIHVTSEQGAGSTFEVCLPKLETQSETHG